ASVDGSPLIVPPPHLLFDGMNAPTWQRITSALAISATAAVVEQQMRRRNDERRAIHRRKIVVE
ncbi:MAG: hypothetical protein ACKOIZ_10550, partial [Actinomycetota bacterium]